MQKGQTLLIVVLVMVIALTVGLAVASRSLTNLRISTDEQSSQKAFSAAEAGLDLALKFGCVPPEDGGSPCATISKAPDGFGSSFTTQVATLSNSEFLINGGNTLNSEDGVDVWLVPHLASGLPNYTASPFSGKLTFYWGENSASCQDAALEIIIVSGTKANVLTTRYAYDSCSSRGNGFDAAAGTGIVGGKAFLYTTPEINISSGMIARVVPLYKNTPVGVKAVASGGSFPSQGIKIESTGTSGNTSRKIIYYQGYKSLPTEFFSHSLFYSP